MLRGIGASSDGKGKGITAPNPIGQKFCLERAWQNAGLSPATATLIEGHGTSTRVGDVVEAQCMADLLKSQNLPVHSVALGSVKSNIGHLKGAAGAAGMLKTALALRDKVLPPSVHCEHPSPDIDFAHSPALRQYRTEAVDSSGRHSATCRRERLRLRRHELSYRARRAHSPQADRKREAVSRCQHLPQTAIPEVVMNAKATPSSPSASTASPVCKTPLRGALVDWRCLRV